MPGRKIGTGLLFRGYMTNVLFRMTRASRNLRSVDRYFADKYFGQGVIWTEQEPGLVFVQ